MNILNRIVVEVEAEKKALRHGSPEVLQMDKREVPLLVSGRQRLPGEQ